MATPYDRIRLVLSGTIAGVQTWSTGITLTSLAAGNSLAGVDLGLLQGFTLAATAEADTWATSTIAPGTSPIEFLWAPDTKLLAVDTYLYRAGSDKAAEQAHQALAAPAGGSGTTTQVAQTCMVVSLRSATPGRRGRGRMYLPATGCPLTGGHLFMTPQVTIAAAATAKMITNLNTIVVGPVQPKVVIGSQFGAYPVTHVEVDDDPDIQRRRSDKILRSQTLSGIVTA